MRPSPRTRLLAASVAMVATLGLAACGDDDDAGEADVTVETVETTDSEVTEVTIGDDTDDTAVTTEETDGSTAGGGEVGTQDEYIEAAREEISSEFDDQDLADCVGEAMINDDVYAAIEEAGMTVEEFSADGPAGLELDEAVADEVGANFAECGNLVPEIIAEGTAQDCAEENITNEQIAEFLAYTLLELPPSAEVEAAAEAADACIQAATTTTS